MMLHSSIKKTQKTPPREIEIARKRMKEIKHGNS
jgi:phage-related protein